MVRKNHTAKSDSKLQQDGCCHRYRPYFLADAEAGDKSAYAGNILVKNTIIQLCTCPYKKQSFERDQFWNLQALKIRPPLMAK